MFRIRFHGRGGQGIKTASRVLGTAFFRAGFEVQDAPRYGAERRGAPISATVRANRGPIWERGIIASPDLVVVADGTLLDLPSAGVLDGLDQHSVLVIDQRWDAHFQKLAPDFPGRVLLLPQLEEQIRRDNLQQVAMAGAGAAARLTGLITRDALDEAVAHELEGLPEATRRRNRKAAFDGFEHMTDMVDFLQEGPAWEPEQDTPPAWVTLHREPAHLAAPVIFKGGTASRVPTGLWRTERPMVDRDRCKGCWWVCATFCPDGVVTRGEDGTPDIDYDHCKGCLICQVQCPSQAIFALPEAEAATLQR